MPDAHQAILHRDIEASIPGRERTENRYGGHFWHGHLDKSEGKFITVIVRYLASRHVFEGRRLASTNRTLSQEERKELALLLGPDRRVPISWPIIDTVRADLPKGDPTPLGRARAIAVVPLSLGRGPHPKTPLHTRRTPESSTKHEAYRRVR